MYGVYTVLFGREITKYTFLYVASIRFWPTLSMIQVTGSPVGVFTKIALLQFLVFEMLRQRAPVGVFTKIALLMFLPF